MADLDGARALKRTAPRHTALVATFGCLVLVVALSVLVAAVVPGANPRHAADHLAVALPLLLLIVILLRVAPAPKPTRLGRWGRWAVVIGLSLMTASLVAEAVGAFGYDGDAVRNATLQAIHNNTFVVDFPGMLAVLVGSVLAFGSLFQRRDDQDTPAAP